MPNFLTEVAGIQTLFLFLVVDSISFMGFRCMFLGEGFPSDNTSEPKLRTSPEALVISIA